MCNADADGQRDDRRHGVAGRVAASVRPWLQGFNGDFYRGVWQKNQVFVRLWIDQPLKAKMGFWGRQV